MVSRETSRHLLLIGLSGTGKTAVAPLLAARLKLPWLDLDALIEARESRSIASLFEAQGESGFRRAESEALFDALARSPHVIALGAGAPCQPGVMSRLLKAGYVVHLEADDTTLERRLSGAVERPLLKADLRRNLEEMRRIRSPVYARAHATIRTEGDTPEGVARRAATEFEEYRDE